MTTNKTDTDIKECVDELYKMFEYHMTYEPDTLNEYIFERKPLIKLEVDLAGLCDYSYRALKEIVKRYKIAPKDECEFIKSDVKRLCVLLFKPYFSVNYWIKDACRKYAKESSDYKFEHGIIEADPPEDLYNSIIVYLKHLIINLAI